MRARNSLKKNAFSLVNGGPTHQLMLCLGSDRQGSPSVVKPVVLFALMAWLPLLMLSAMQGLALSNVVKLSFLHDIGAYSRFLAAVPLLIAAESIIDLETKAGVRQFINSGVVPEADLPDFESAIKEVINLRDLPFVEALIFGIALAGAWVAFQDELSNGISTWQALLFKSGEKLTWAGWWYILVSIPIYQFLLYRWLWRFVIWSRFLWRTAKLNLQLIPTHPDLAGGIGFLAVTQSFFGLIILSISIVASAIWASKIFYQGAEFLAFRLQIAALVVLSELIFLAPLLAFIPKLTQIKIKGLRDYGVLATRYSRLFDEKWVKGNVTEGEEILGSADIQSLADLGNSFEVVRRMRVVPFGIELVLAFALAALAPIVPLLFTVFPVEEILKKLLEVLA